MKPFKFLLVLILFAFFPFIVSSSLDDMASYVCCGKTVGPVGGYCQNAPADSCDPEFASMDTSCEESTICMSGTCVYESLGDCKQDVPKLTCENGLVAGKWYQEDIDSIEQCQRICCLIGSEVSFVTETECKRQATEYGVDVKIRSDITTEAQCQELAYADEFGACTYEEEGSTRCKMETKESCLMRGRTFYEGILCTADGLSDCAKTKNTKCYNDDAYYVDSCGNLANIYDPGKYSNDDYWEKIMSPTCSGSDCGDCDYARGSKCEVKNSKAQCVSLDCSTVGKKHGESWCDSSGGTYDELYGEPIRVNPLNHEFSSTTTRDKIEQGYNALNLPGSRYYKLTCWEGEVITEPCMDYRNAICKEANIGTTSDSFSNANCYVNNWRPCFDIGTKTECENNIYDCKWLEGDRFDGEIVDPEKKSEQQGSCVPLYAPGFNFWSEDTLAGSICGLSKDGRGPTYAIQWLEEITSDVDEWSVGTIADKCFGGGCFAIPDNGVKTSSPGDMNFNKDDWPFETYSVWIDFLQERARSIGDCGYKPNLAGVYGQSESEIMTVQFEDLSQSGSVQDRGKLKNLYIGNERFSGYRGGLKGSNDDPFYWRAYTWWKNANPYYKK